jgi:hypothetical protein
VDGGGRENRKEGRRLRGRAEGKEEGEGRSGKGRRRTSPSLTCGRWREEESVPQGSQQWLQATDKVGEKDAEAYGRVGIRGSKGLSWAFEWKPRKKGD